MTALAALQQAFQSYVLGGDTDIATRIAGAPDVDPHRRLRIYFDAYRLRLVEVLAGDYEALQAVMGAEAFRAACLTYVETTPSIYRNVRWYGAGLPEFLRQTPTWSENVVLHEVASFEWTLTLAFDAPDTTVIRFDDLAAVPPDAWPELSFVLHPSLNLIQLRSNAPAMRKAVDAGEPLPEPNVLDEPRPWLVWRKELTACFRSLSEHEAWAINAAKNRATFTALCEGLCEWFAPEEAAPQAAGLLRQWVDDELISGLAEAPQ